MGITLSEILEILTLSPGYLVYHLVVSLPLILTGSIALSKVDRGQQGQRARHVLLGTGCLLLLQVILFATSSLTTVELFGITSTYAVVERTISALTIIWIIWTFVEAEKKFLNSSLTTLSNLTIIFLGVATIVFLTLQPPNVIFSHSWVDISWQVTSLLLIIIGLIFLLMNQPQNGIVGGVILLLLAGGHVTQMLLPASDSSLAGPVRLAQTLAMPFLITLVQRFSGPVERTGESESVPDTPEEEPIDTKPKLMNLLINISLQETPEERFKAVVRAISLSIVADICYIVHMPNEIGEIRVDAGYDLIREEFLRPASLQRGQIPLIINAWEENNILQLPSNYSGTPDVVTLYELIQYHRIGNLLAYPLSMPDQPVVGGLIFLSPYTTKEWDREAFEILNEIKANLARIFYYADQENSFREELEQTQVAYNLLRDEKRIVEQALKEKEAVITELETDVKRIKAKYQMEKMENAKQLGSMNQKIEELNREKSTRDAVVKKLEQTTAVLRQLKKERDQLRTELTRAEAKIKHLSVHAGQTGPTRLSMNNQVISLDSLVANVRMRVADKLKRQNVKLEFVNPDGRQTVKVDPELVQTIITNLVENAIYASPVGASIQFRQSLSMETGMLILQVTDLGEGLTQSEQAALFSANNEAIPGIGSVQAIRNAARAIRILNGKIWLKSKKGQYTTFRVQLPVRIMD
jgi:signal transduction histidine kinase